MRYFFIIIFILAIFASGLYFNLDLDLGFFSGDSRQFQANLLVQQEELAQQKELPAASQNLKGTDSEEITAVFCGDVMISRGVANVISKNGDSNFPFLKIRDFLRSADLVFANLEGPISDKGRNQGSIYSFRAAPEMTEVLKVSGFDVLSLANNHILDWGREALGDTVKLLGENGIESIGAGRDFDEANRSAIKEIKGIKIAFLAYTDLYPKSLAATADSGGISYFNIETAGRKIKSLKESGEADIVVVSFHWGEEYREISNLKQQEIGHSLVDAGADLVIGHHPHVIQELENYNGKWIAYSLGNFLFDQDFSPKTTEGLMLKVKIKNKNLSVEPIMIKINSDFQTEIFSL